MSIIEALILGLVQGLTEFIPVSSSGHLIILHEWLGDSGGLAFDVALHIGTLSALLVFFGRELAGLVQGLKSGASDRRLIRRIILATIPAVIFGLVVQEFAAGQFRSSLLVAVNLIIIAGFMLLAEYMFESRKPKDLGRLKKREAVAIGLAQALALIPGISRSGSTITAGLFAGLGREAATKFSFLMAVPITFGAIVKVIFAPDTLDAIAGDLPIFITGIVAAFISGCLAINFLIKFVANHSLRAFAYYRIALGAGIIAWLTILR